MPSSSAPVLRNRAPLASLPVSLFIHPSNTLPSPISLPLKRSAPSGCSTSTSTSESSTRIDSPDRMKVRKVSVGEVDGGETIKRHRVKEVTPKAKSILDRDELGTGRSPARRLFVDASEGASLGIIGAVPATTTPPIPNRALAPSPPIISTPTSSSSTLPVTIDLNADITSHDIGFVIYSDSTSMPPRLHVSIGAGTPDSRRQPPVSTFNPPLALDAEAHIPSSPASSSRSCGSYYDENQENVPPPLSPSKSYSTQSSPSSSRHKRHLEDDFDYPGSGSRARRIMERSKLGLESVLGHSNGHNDELEDEGEELTPGKVMRRDVWKGKARLTREVDRM